MIRKVLIVVFTTAFCLFVSPSIAYSQVDLTQADLQIAAAEANEIQSNQGSAEPQNSPASPATGDLDFARESTGTITKCCNVCSESTVGNKVKLKCSRCIDVPDNGACETADAVERLKVSCTGTFLVQGNNLTCYL